MYQARENKLYNDIDASHKTIRDIEFASCKFVGCTFKESTFINVMFNECTFENCSFINATFEKSKIHYCSFLRCTLISVNWSTLSSDIAYSIEKIDKCLLKYNDFTNMTLKKIDFGKSDIIFSTFHQVNLSEGNFSDCNLENTSFSMCDLQKSDFRSARDFSIDIDTCKLKGARFSLSNIIGLVRNLGIKIE